MAKAKVQTSDIMPLVDLVGIEEELRPELALHFHEPRGGFSCIQHPLVYSVPHAPHLNAYVNKMYERKRRELDEAFDAQDWPTFIYLHERPYRAFALRQVADLIQPDRQYWKILSDVWTDSENIWQYRRVWQQLLRSKRKDRVHMMNAYERRAYARMPATITCYRGACPEELKRKRIGYSWTRKHQTARFFASRFDKGGSILKGTVAKSDVLAFLNGRRERELVIPRPSRVKWEVVE